MIVLAPQSRLAEAEVRQALLPMPLPARARCQTTAPEEREQPAYDTAATAVQ
jgi:hypothetical protein